jgi:hypothetical protein
MGKTYRRDESRRPRGGKDFKRFKKSNKFKNWDDNSKGHIHIVVESDKDPVDDPSESI